MVAAVSSTCIGFGLLAAWFGAAASLYLYASVCCEASQVAGCLGCSTSDGLLLKWHLPYAFYIPEAAHPQDQRLLLVFCSTVCFEGLSVWLPASVLLKRGRSCCPDMFTCY